MTSFGGPSFRDMTRVAGSSPQIWSDIFLTNKRLSGAIRVFARNLERFLSLLEDRKEEEVRSFLESMVRLKERLSREP